MGIPIRSGRSFEARDDRDGPLVAIVDRVLARRFWPDGGAVGQRITAHGTSREIVAVVGSVRHFGPAREAPPALYVPQHQDPSSEQVLVARAGVAPAGLVRSVRRAVQELDPGLPVYGVQTMSHVVQRALAEPRLRAVLLALFGAAALVLATIGVYGVVYQTVSRRTREIGIRVALGARRREVLKLVVGGGMRLAVAGAGAGALAALAATRLLASLLFEVRADDGAIFALTAMLLLGVAFGASFLPAHRASGIGPATALRHE